MRGLLEMTEFANYVLFMFGDEYHYVPECS